MQTYTRMLAKADAVEVAVAVTLAVAVADAMAVVRAAAASVRPILADAMAVPRPPFVPGNAAKRGGANECHFGIELQ